MFKNKVELLNLYDPDKTPTENGLPIAGYDEQGIASFDENSFDVATGHVKLKYDFAKYLFKIDIVETGEDYETYTLIEVPDDYVLTITINQVYQFLPLTSSTKPNLYLKVNGVIYRLRSASGDAFVKNSLRENDVVTMYCADDSGVLYTNVEVKGATGEQGIQGKQGEQGTRGSLWYIWSGAPTNENSVNDYDIALDISTGDVYEFGNGTWYKKGNIRGPRGIQGIQGEPGKDGVAVKIIGGVFYDPLDPPSEIKEDYEPVPVFADTEEGTAYVIDDGEIAGQYDLWMHNTGETDWVKINNWGGVPGPQGPKGNTGNGIADIYTISHTKEGNETITKLQVTYTDNGKEPSEVEVHAKNGAQGIQGERGYSIYTYPAITEEFEEHKVINLDVDLIEPVHDNFVQYEPIITDNGYYLLVNNEAISEDNKLEVMMVKDFNSEGGGGGEPIVITNPSTATSGTLTMEQLGILQEDDNNYIIFDNELYRLEDKQHDTGYLIYTHVGHNSSNNFTVKCITITVNTRGWVLTNLNLSDLVKKSGDTMTGNLNMGSNRVNFKSSYVVDNGFGLKLSTSTKKVFLYSGHSSIDSTVSFDFTDFTFDSDYNYKFPKKNGTLALTSDSTSYLYELILEGGDGAIHGTRAYFSSTNASLKLADIQAMDVHIPVLGGYNTSPSGPIYAAVYYKPMENTLVCIKPGGYLQYIAYEEVSNVYIETVSKFVL